MNEGNYSQFTMRQISIQRKNLVQICRLTVKTLIDKASITSIDDDSEELINFCAAIEQILTYRQKAQRTWYGIEEVRPFWEFIQTTCRYLPNNCINSMATLENVKSHIGKGRAWIRCVLMEKRMSEYLSHAVQQTKIVRRFYQEGSVILSEDFSLLCGVLLGLNSIDFSFCLKGHNQELKSPLYIDYTPYLLFQQSEESANKDFEELCELSIDTSMNSSSVIEQDSWAVKYKDLEKSHRTIKEQKGYLEELLRMREHQLQDLQRKHQNLLNVFRKFDDDAKKDRHQMENVVIELQQQLTSVSSKFENVTSKYDVLVNKLKSGFIDLEEVNCERSSPWEPTDSTTQESFSERDSNNIPASAARLVVSGTRSSHLEMKPESESMLAMAGSFSSQRSSEETSSHHSNNTSKMEERAISDPDEAIVINFPDNDKQSESSEGFSDITTEEHKAFEEMSESEVKGDNFDKKDKSESESKGDNFENKDKVDILEQHSAVTDDSKDKDLTEHGHENIQLKIETDILQTSSSSEPGTSSPEMIQSQGEDNSTASGEDNSLSSPEILKPADDDNSNVLEPGEDYITSSPEMIHSGEDNSNVSDSSGIEEQYDMVTDEISKSDGGENSKKQDEDDTATG